MAITIRNLLIKVDENGILEVTAGEITVGVDTKQVKPFSVFNPGAGERPPPPRHEERVAPEPQPRVSAAVPVTPRPAPVAPESTIKEAVAEYNKKATEEAAERAMRVMPVAPPDAPPREPLAAIRAFVHGNDEPANDEPAPAAKSKKKPKGQRLSDLYPERYKNIHTYKAPGSRLFSKKPPELGGSQPESPPAMPPEDARKLELEVAAATAMAKEVAAVMVMQKAAIAAATLKTPAAKAALKQAKATVASLRKVTREAHKARNLARYAIDWHRTRNVKGQITKVFAAPPVPEPEPSEPAPPEPVRPAPSQISPALLAAARKKFGISPDQPRAGDAPLSFP